MVHENKGGDGGRGGGGGRTLKFPQLRTFSAPTQFPKRKEEEEEEEDLPFVRFPQNSFLFSFLPAVFSVWEIGRFKGFDLFLFPLPVCRIGGRFGNNLRIHEKRGKKKSPPQSFAIPPGDDDGYSIVSVCGGNISSRRRLRCGEV